MDDPTNPIATSATTKRTSMGVILELLAGELGALEAAVDDRVDAVDVEVLRDGGGDGPAERTVEADALHRGNEAVDRRRGLELLEGRLEALVRGDAQDLAARGREALTRVPNVGRVERERILDPDAQSARRRDDVSRRRDD